MARVLAGTARRIRRLLEERAGEEEDALARDESLLALLAVASLRTRIATGSRRGESWRRLGDRVEPWESTASGADPQASSRVTQHGGMSLHADVAVPARDRRRLERLCRSKIWTDTRGLTVRAPKPENWRGLTFIRRLTADAGVTRPAADGATFAKPRGTDLHRIRVSTPRLPPLRSTKSQDKTWRTQLEPENKTKTFFMVLSLAAFVGVGAACFGLFRTPPPSTDQRCEGLTGQAKIDCEAESR